MEKIFVLIILSVPIKSEIMAFCMAEATYHSYLSFQTFVVF